MSWQSSLSWKNAKARAEITQKIRQFFLEKNVIEVETPLLSNGTITDIYLDAFTSRYDFLSDTSPLNSSVMYLQTSPEFAMKRLLASGFGSIFQICKAFRHEEYGRHHNPEFTMLEWYRLGFDHFQLMDEVSQLLVAILSCQQPSQVSYQSVFLEHVAVDPLETSRGELISVIQQYNKLEQWIVDEPDNDILLQFIFSEIIEEKIGITAPCFVYNFPSTQASLAKISPIDNRVAERFECYFQGLELVNGFHELTDESQQLSRFNNDNDVRLTKGLVNKPIDNNFIKALTHGLPECAGVAVGVDRLVMLALKVEHISDVISFSVDNA